MPIDNSPIEFAKNLFNRHIPYTFILICLSGNYFQSINHLSINKFKIVHFTPSPTYQFELNVHLLSVDRYISQRLGLA